jgi:hypothetical protein
MVCKPRNPRMRKYMDRKPHKIDVGTESVVMGQATGVVGDRSVVVGPTDDRGNTIINQPMAVGYGAQAGTNSIAIGAYATAGVVDGAHLAAELSRLHEAMKQDSDAAMHQESIAAVGAAAEAAKKNDGASAARHLKVAGKSALDFATGIGASLAAAVIAKAIGM